MTSATTLNDLAAATLEAGAMLPEIGIARSTGRDLCHLSLIDMAECRVRSLRGVLMVIETSEHDDNLSPYTRDAVSAAGYLADEVKGLLALVRQCTGRATAFHSGANIAPSTQKG